MTVWTAPEHMREQDSDVQAAIDADTDDDLIKCARKQNLNLDNHSLLHLFHVSSPPLLLPFLLTPSPSSSLLGIDDGRIHRYLRS